MSLFSEFICTLSHQELQQLQQLPLRGKQAAIFECILSDPTNEKAVERIASEHGMSKSHLHATLSVLLQRSYDHFIPDRGFNLLLFLQIHGLESHLKREFQAQEKQMRDLATVQELNIFYIRTLHLLIGVTSSKFDTKFFNALLAMCTKTSQFPATETKVTKITCEVLRDVLIVAVNPSREHPKYHRDVLLKQLTETEKLIQPEYHQLSFYHLEYAYSLFYAIINPSPSDFSTHLNLLTTALLALPDYIRADEEPKLEMRRASLAFSQGDLSKAFQLYLNIYLKEGANFFRMYAFHLDRFTRVALAKKELPLVEQLLDNGYGAFANRLSPLGTSEAIFRTKVALFKNNILQARNELSRAYKLNTGFNYLLSMDLQLRFLEIIIELYNNSSTEYIETLIQRSIKHFHRRGMTLRDGGAITNFYALKELLDGKPTSKLIVQSLTSGFREYPSLAVLLQNVLQYYSPKK